MCQCNGQLTCSCNALACWPAISTAEVVSHVLQATMLNLQSFGKPATVLAKNASVRNGEPLFAWPEASHRSQNGKVGRLTASQ